MKVTYIHILVSLPIEWLWKNVCYPHFLKIWYSIEREKKIHVIVILLIHSNWPRADTGERSCRVSSHNSHISYLYAGTEEMKLIVD